MTCHHCGVSSEPDSSFCTHRPEWDDEPTAVVNLETSPGRVSFERMAQLMTGGKQ